MIVFDLICDNEHRFEGWFASGEEFARQQNDGWLACPHCHSDEISKLPTAKIARGGAAPESAQAIAALLTKLAERAEDVGTGFAAEARRIHYEETPARLIRGKASSRETAELLEEGIPVLPLFVPPRDERH